MNFVFNVIAPVTDFDALHCCLLSRDDLPKLNFSISNTLVAELYKSSLEKVHTFVTPFLGVCELDQAPHHIYPFVTAL